MKIFIPPNYTEVVRVEFINCSTKEMRQITFYQATVEQVYNHVHQKLKVGIKGIKVRVIVRISDKEKKWGKLKSCTVFIEDLDKAIIQISKGVPKSSKY